MTVRIDQDTLGNKQPHDFRGELTQQKLLSCSSCMSGAGQWRAQHVRAPKGSRLTEVPPSCTCTQYKWGTEKPWLFTASISYNLMSEASRVALVNSKGSRKCRDLEWLHLSLPQAEEKGRNFPQTPSKCPALLQESVLFLEKKKVLVAQSCRTLCALWTVAHQAPLPIKFSRQEFWSG